MSILILFLRQLTGASVGELNETLAMSVHSVDHYIKYTATYIQMSEHIDEYILSRLASVIAKGRSVVQRAQNIINFVPDSVRVSFNWTLSIV